MKLDNRKTRDMFAMFTDLPDEQIPDWSWLCDSAALKMSGMLRDGVNLSQHMDRLCAAAAACAYCDYTVISGGGTSSSDEIRVGDISLKSSDVNNEGGDAIGIRDHFLAEIADLIKAPTGVAVCSTGGPL